MYNKNDIVSFKLINGEEMISRFISELDNSYIVEKPLTLFQTQQGLSLIPSLVTVNLDNEIRINKSAIAIHAKSRDEMMSAWMEATSGLVAPKNSKLVI